MAEITTRGMSKQMSDRSPTGRPRAARPRYSQPAISSQYTSYYGPESFSRHTVMSPPPQISHMTAGPYLSSRTVNNTSFRNQSQRIYDRRLSPTQEHPQTYFHRTSRTAYNSGRKRADPFQPPQRQTSGSSLNAYDGPGPLYGNMTSATPVVSSSDDYIQMYRLALSDSKTGITLQERKINGRTRQNVFTGADAAEWFMENLEGILTVDGAASVGRKLVALGVVQNVSNSELTDFIVSPREFYCFTDNTAVKQTLSVTEEPVDDTPAQNDVNTTYHDFTKTDRRGWFSKCFGNCCSCW